jgi:hypothetical protein
MQNAVKEQDRNENGHKTESGKRSHHSRNPLLYRSSFPRHRLTGFCGGLNNKLKTAEVISAAPKIANERL